MYYDNYIRQADTNKGTNNMNSKMNPANTAAEDEKDQRMIAHFMVLASQINDLRTYTYANGEATKNSHIFTARRTMSEMTPTGKQIALGLHELEFGMTWFAVVEGK